MISRPGKVMEIIIYQFKLNQLKIVILVITNFKEFQVWEPFILQNTTSDIY